MRQPLRGEILESADLSGTGRGVASRNRKTPEAAGSGRRSSRYHWVSGPSLENLIGTKLGSRKF